MQNLRIWIFALFFLCTANVFFVWALEPRYFYAFFIFLVPFVSIGSLSKIRLKSKKINISIFILATYIYISLPFREYDDFGFWILLSFALVSIILLDSFYYFKVINLLAIIIAIVSVSSLIVFITNIFGLDLPWVEIGQDFRKNPSDYYRLYPGSLVLSTQTWASGSMNIVRTSGIFMEPGHFAMFCAGLLVANGFSFEKSRFKWVAVGGFLTLSPAFYLLFVAAMATKNISNILKFFKNYFSIVALGVLIVGSLAFAPEALFDRLISKNIDAASSGGVQEILDERASGGFENFYNKLTVSQKLIGIGIGGYEKFGFSDAQASDYRMLVVRSGFISLMLFFFFTLYISNIPKKRSDGVLILIYFFIIALHRSGMLLQMWFSFFIVSAALKSIHQSRMKAFAQN